MKNLLFPIKLLFAFVATQLFVLFVFIKSVLVWRLPTRIEIKIKNKDSKKSLLKQFLNSLC